MPLIVTASFAVHVWTRLTTTHWAVLAWEAADFNVHPVAAYLLTRVLCTQLKIGAVHFTRHIIKHLGAKRSGEDQKLQVLVAVLLSQAVAAVLAIGLLLAGPALVPKIQGPVSVALGLKLTVTDMLQRMDIHPGAAMVGASSTPDSSLYALSTVSAKASSIARSLRASVGVSIPTAFQFIIATTKSKANTCAIPY
jgi:hypothetical protein